jgi:hypothetical protein
MIRFAVGGSSGGVGVGCQVVKFRGSIVRTLGHGVLLVCSMQTIRSGFIGKIALRMHKEQGLHIHRFSAKKMWPSYSDSAANQPTIQLG